MGLNLYHISDNYLAQRGINVTPKKTNNVTWCLHIVYEYLIKTLQRVDISFVMLINIKKMLLNNKLESKTLRIEMLVIKVLRKIV